MKKELEQLKTKLSHFLPKEKVGHPPHQVTRSWFISIGVSFFIGIVLCCVGVYQFFETRKIEVVHVETGEPLFQTFSKSRLLKVVEQYQNQALHFADMRSVPPTIPSVGTKEMEAEEVADDDALRVEEDTVDEVLETEESSELGESERPELVP